MQTSIMLWAIGAVAVNAISLGFQTSFEEHRGFAIRGHNTDILGSGFTRQQCQRRCEDAYFNCQSFEYHAGAGQCVLSTASGPMERNNEGWDLYVARGSGNGGGHGGRGTCRRYSSCSACINRAGSECAWNNNAVPPACVPRTECDFTYASPEPDPYGLTAYHTPSASVCVEDARQCGVRPPNGAVIEPNPDAGYGCTTHDQCGYQQYCYSCDLCLRYGPGVNCGDCRRSSRVAGQCGPIQNCRRDQDSITGVCPWR